MLQADDIPKTRQWFKALQFYGLSLGNWRRRRNALANIMINGMNRRDHRNTNYEGIGKKVEHPHHQASHHFSENSAITSATNNNGENNGPTYGSHRNNVENLL